MDLGKASTKILVRNIPFQAKKEEIVQLFRTFGEISAVRLPKKMAGAGENRKTRPSATGATWPASTRQPASGPGSTWTRKVNDYKLHELTEIFY